MSAKYRIGEAEAAKTSLASSKYRHLTKKLAEYVYPQLRKNPHFGPNIKRLKGELDGFSRYRVGKFRIFYTIDESETLVIIHEIEDRKDTY